MASPAPSESRVSIGDFLYQEALEKSFEIEVKARKEYDKTKSEIVEKEERKLFDEFEQKKQAKVSEYKM